MRIKSTARQSQVVKVTCALSRLLPTKVGLNLNKKIITLQEGVKINDLTKMFDNVGISTKQWKILC